MNVYRTDVVIYGTLYIKAESKGQAKRIAIQIEKGDLEVDGPDICDLSIDNPNLPKWSLSPAMTIGPIVEGDLEKVN